MLQTSVIISSTPSYIERFSPFICACPLCPCITCLQPCEQANEYSIMYCEDDWSNWGQVHFEVKEVSKFMQRFICPPSKRSLELVDQRKFSEVHIKVEKPYKFSFLCFQRPEMLIYQRGQYIGKVMEELQWTMIKCTFYKLTCFDKNNALLYTISASCCQPGLICMLLQSLQFCLDFQYFLFRNHYFNHSLQQFINQLLKFQNIYFFVSYYEHQSLHQQASKQRFNLTNFLNDSYKLLVQLILQQITILNAKYSLQQLKVLNKKQTEFFFEETLPCQSCSEIEFQIKDRNNEQVGKICHLFGGFRREWCTKSDTYGINFPEFATIEEKIILIMAGIFIDYSQFQNY